MTYLKREELENLIREDPYMQERVIPSDKDKMVYLREVNFHCPLCKKDLKPFNQEKNNNLFEIAHIYPNRPTVNQFEELQGEERLGDSCEAFENKIALCFDCHSTQDYHTSKKDYRTLLSIKKKLLLSNDIQIVKSEMNIEEEIVKVVNAIASIEFDLSCDINYDPVSVDKKIPNDYSLLKTKITTYNKHYYSYVRQLFYELDGDNEFKFDILSAQIKATYLKINHLTKDYSTVFDNLVDWIQNKTDGSKEACEVIISFFIQNCEVFHEISK